MPCPLPSPLSLQSRASSTADTLFSLCLSATNPLILHLSAYNVNSRPADISRYKDGERFWTKVLNPPDTFNQKNNLIVPGPACLKYLQDAKQKSSGYEWPTERLAACMSKSASIPSAHWLMDSQGRKITCQLRIPIFSAD